MLQDDRFLLNAVSLKAGIMGQVAHVASLPDAIWRRLLGIGNISGFMSPLELRHCVVKCMLKGVTYPESEAFNLLQGRPLSLTQNDTRANMTDLDLHGDDLNLDATTADILLCWRLEGPEKH